MITTLIDVRADALACPRAYGDPRLSGVLLDPAAAVPAMAGTASKGGRYADHDACSADFGDAQVSTVDNFTTRSGPPPLCSPPA